MDPFPLVLTLHLLGGCVWTGGHLVLALRVLPAALRARDPAAITAFERAFEPVGLPALVVQVATGLWLAARFGWTPAALLAPAGGLQRAIDAKLALLALTVALAAHARLRLIPGLRAEGLPLLAAHIVAVTVTSVLFVAVGASLRVGGL